MKTPLLLARPLRKLFTAAMLTVCAAAPALAATSFLISLDGLQEPSPIGPVVTPAFGNGTATLNDLGSGNFSLSYALTFSSDLNWAAAAGAGFNNGGSISVTNFHVHNQVRGQNGGVVYGIFGPDQDSDADTNGNDVTVAVNGDNTTTVAGNWDPADGNPAGNINTFAPALLALAPGADAPLYFNVHTTSNPSGFIRGQIVAVPEPSSVALALAGAGIFLTRRRRS